jgi:glycosyltransferase involved in cell wall biosynthesis
MPEISEPHIVTSPMLPRVVFDAEQSTRVDRKLRILFFTSTLGGGGAEKHLLRLINHLDRERFEVSVAVARNSGEFEPALAADVQRHCLTGTRQRSATVGMLRSIRPLRRLIERERPDVVFSVLDLPNIANVVALRGLASRPKIVLGIQTPPSIAYGNSWHPVSQLILRLIPKLYPHAESVVALSKGVASELLSISPSLQDRLTVIHNAGVETDVLEKATEPLPQVESRPLVVACGRLKSLKGFDFLIDAIAEVRRTVPATLWIVGEGEERSALEKRIKRRRLNGHVRLLGFKSNPFKYMAAADVFVLSSLFEGFGNVIVEAMACGAPVVATDCPYGPREIISDGQNGMLVPPANASALAEAILRVLSDEVLSKRLSSEGKKRAEDFDAHRIAAAYEAVFVKALNGASGQSRAKAAVS